METINNSILIVDDNHENIKVLGIALKDKDYNLTVAFNGPDALEILDTTAVDLVLLDVMMPGMDGFEVCRRVKANPNLKDIPIIFITALTETSNIVKGFEVGGVDYITKPFKKEELFARVNTQLQIQNQRRQLEQTIQSRDKLYSIIAHDLRSPLANIKTILTALSEGHIDHDSFETLVPMPQKSTNETYDLLENLLYWSRSQLDNLKPQKGECDVKSIVTETFDLLKPNADKKEILLEMELNGAKEMLADKNMMKTVLRNLTSNAIKFTPKGGTITLATGEDNGYTQLLVKDTGLGIKKENIEKLFNKSSNFTTTGTESEKGSGLGLKLTYEFVKQHGGEINVESEEGKGSVFTVSIPTK